MNSLANKIKYLKEEKDAIILAHYYVVDEVQAIADYVGDSYFLSKVAANSPNKTILLCGVSFMGESAKILSPEKTILMPDALAHCPMAHMVTVDSIEAVRNKYEDVAVVCYINSTAEIKAYCDVCVTSSNALKIVKKMPQKNIYFIPDENLGRYVAGMVPEKNFIFCDGFCHVHKSITMEDVVQAKISHPKAKVLAHPECTLDVLALADYVGSTSGIINYPKVDDANSYIVCTEIGVLHEIKKNNPDKSFFSIGFGPVCPDMKKVTLEKIINTLENNSNQIEVDQILSQKAALALTKMLELAE